jgi:hypothetical protein
VETLGKKSSPSIPIEEKVIFPSLFQLGRRYFSKSFFNLLLPLGRSYFSKSFQKFTFAMVTIHKKESLLISSFIKYLRVQNLSENIISKYSNRRNFHLEKVSKWKHLEKN